MNSKFGQTLKAPSLSTGTRILPDVYIYIYILISAPQACACIPIVYIRQCTESLSAK